MLLQAAVAPDLVQREQRNQRQQYQTADDPHVRNERRSRHQDGGQEKKEHGQEDVGTCIIITVRKRDLGRRSEVQILTGNVVRARADIPVIEIVLRSERLIVLSWWNLLGHEDAEQECRGK